MKDTKQKLIEKQRKNKMVKMPNSKSNKKINKFALFGDEE